MEISIPLRHKVIAWHLDCRSIDSLQWPQLLGLLSLSEQERADKFYFDHDRQSYIAAHAITRAVLAFYSDIQPNKIEFSASDFGKPEVIIRHHAARLRVNLSHTRHMVAVALTEENDIGIDIEWLGRKDSCLDLAPTVFTHEEQAILGNTPANRQKEIFLTFWTLKEAYIKAIGKGLSLPLTDFHFNLDPLAIHFKQQHERQNIDDPESWYLKHYRPGPDHVAAIAAQGVDKHKLDCKIEAAPLQAIIEKFRASP
ncbi:4'-phosphopantetheinyl transferase family protein [Kordiimonas pumila]|uniref:4'-phosphopantetheinyl transferase family protein n=1 Tax=Kordiimonas pumila TaxID=2161677 RepID=A0ABV7D306_9PROT|nr:4'-phosphopantetheinyl transferase superfamily protein [Kordiimonas pumila]